MVTSAERVILVTGGGGFIGNRFVEVIHLTGFGRARVGVRRWASAARAARFPIDIVLCDVLDVRQIAAAMHGVDVVVHCAVGDERVIVEGTRNVLEAAARNQVSRVLHISTAEVYGSEVSGRVDETRPCTTTGSPYANAKSRGRTARLGVQFARASRDDLSSIDRLWPVERSVDGGACRTAAIRALAALRAIRRGHVQSGLRRRSRRRRPLVDSLGPRRGPGLQRRRRRHRDLERVLRQVQPGDGAAAARGPIGAAHESQIDRCGRRPYGRRSCCSRVIARCCGTSASAAVGCPRA